MIFRNWRRLEFLETVVDTPRGKDYRNIDPIIGLLVNEKVATFKELKTEYTLEEALMMYEAVIVPKYNEYMAQKRANEKASRRMNNGN